MSELRRVGLNLLYLVPGETGGSEVYARNLVPKLAEQRPDLELVAFVNREAAHLPLVGHQLVHHPGQRNDRHVGSLPYHRGHPDRAIVPGVAAQRNLATSAGREFWKWVRRRVGRARHSR